MCFIYPHSPLFKKIGPFELSLITIPIIIIGRNNIIRINNAKHLSIISFIAEYFMLHLLSTNFSNKYTIMEYQSQTTLTYE